MRPLLHLQLYVALNVHIHVGLRADANGKSSRMRGKKYRRCAMFPSFALVKFREILL